MYLIHIRGNKDVIKMTNYNSLELTSEDGWHHRCKHEEQHSEKNTTSVVYYF